MDLKLLLKYAVLEKKASDILIIAGMPATIKVDGVITKVTNEDIKNTYPSEYDEQTSKGNSLSPADTEKFVTEVYALANDRDIKRLRKNGDDDFSFALAGLSRFRVNALRQRGSFGLIIRVVSFNLPDIKKLNIPNQILELAMKPRGLILVTGPAGSGKTTTLACLVDYINSNKKAHIITIEDPIEFLHHHKESIVTQREIATDTNSYDTALRAALREAPDIILLGEMRDAETIRAAVTAAETGHLVISTLHTLGVSNTIDRIIDSFPPEQQQQIRTQLSMVIEGVVSKQLLQSTNEDGVQEAAYEIMTANSAVRNTIRESRAHQLDNIIAQSSSEGMILMDQAILKLVQSNKITKDEALRRCINPEWMNKRINM